MLSRASLNLRSQLARAASSSSSAASGNSHHHNPHVAIAPGDLEEFSVIYTNRATNFDERAPFGDVMRSISSNLKDVYKASKCVVLPGSGTYGMEAAARQFGGGNHALVM